MVDFIKINDEKKNEKETKPSQKIPSNPFFNWKVIIIIFLFIFILSSIISSITYSMTPKIAVVPITGPIMSEKQTTLYGTSLSSRDIANTLNSLANDDSVKGVILDINSPGGSPVASEEISLAIEKLSTKKPVYALINEVGASGAFWIAVSADKVYASSMSTVGSIGVTSVGFGFEKFIENYNVSYRKLTAGEFKDLGTPFREMQEAEKQIIQEVLDEVHSNFVKHIAVSRNMQEDKVWEYATGEIFLGSKAYDLGFIDEIGYYPDVLEDMKFKTGTIDPIIVNYGPEPTLIDILGVTALADLFPKMESQIMLT